MTVVSARLSFILLCDACGHAGGGAPWDAEEPRRSGSDLKPVKCIYCSKALMRWVLRLHFIRMPPTEALRG